MISGVNNIEEIGRMSSDSSSRWLNVVLDLNGILCACELAWKARGFRNSDLRVHSTTMPTEVGKKFVWVRPGCSDFLLELSTFATITVWSSLLKSTTRDICNYLFGPSLVNPLRILGQEDCDRVSVRKVGNRMFYMKEVGTQKDIFLKSLSNHLFNSFDSCYTLANTLVIDDSPIKHMLNLSENVILLPTWSYGGDGAITDSILMEELLPYLLNLHWSQEGVAEFRSSHPLGRMMFYNNQKTCSQYSRIMKAIEDWESSSH